MTRRNARRLLWIVALLALPVPFFLGEPELAPVLRLFFLTGLLGAVLVAEGGSTLPLLVGLGVVQGLVYAALFWLTAGLLARMLEKLAAPSLRSAVVAVLALGLLVMSLGEIYDTPLSSKRPRSNLTQIFE